MGDVFRKAVSEISALPDAAQDEIGRQLLEFLERRNALKADIEEGLKSLAAGRGRKIDGEAFIKRMNARNSGR